MLSKCFGLRRMNCPLLFEAACAQAITEPYNRMVKDILCDHKQCNKEVKRKIELSLHYDPIIYTPYLDIERQSVWINLTISCKHPTPVQAG